MKEFLINHKKTIFFLSITIAIVILATIIILIFIGVTNYKKINSEIDSVYTTFENTDDRTEKYNILTDFIADSENYSKYQETEKNYQSKISEMKNYFAVYYENLIEENSIDISDKTTKEELSTAISNLKEVKKTINSNNIIKVDDFISKIDSEIEHYEIKIAEIEAAEKAEEVRVKKETKELNKNSQTTDNKDNKITNSSSKTSDNNSSNEMPVFNSNKAHKWYYMNDENGNEIPETRVYWFSNGDYFDYNYNYIGNEPNLDVFLEELYTKYDSIAEEKENAKKGPKPEKYSVMLDKDYIDDGWFWEYHSYAWVPKNTEWNWENDHFELVSAEWEIICLYTWTSSNDPQIMVHPKTIENIKKIMIAPPTLEQSKNLIEYSEEETPNYNSIRYGTTDFRVYMGD